MDIDIKTRLDDLEEKIGAACLRSGRKRGEIKLMAVTKFHSLDVVESAWDAGIRLFGESRVQEGTEKFTRFFENHPGNEEGGKSAALHLIGSLQRNKAKTAAGFFDCIQSVDRLPLVEELGALTSQRENPLMILLEYHTGEESKSGFPSLDSLFRAADLALGFDGLKIQGLMTMAPYTSDKDAVRGSFRELVRARDELEKRFPGNWPCLSMGMTNDYEIAIEEGSTLLRIGTAIFGERAS